MEILSGLDMTAIVRLKNTWEVRRVIDKVVGAGTNVTINRVFLKETCSR
jgi:hypothetical protein